jgi:hypothetical protein
MGAPRRKVVEDAMAARCYPAFATAPSVSKADSGGDRKVIGFSRNGDRLAPESLIGFGWNG